MPNTPNPTLDQLLKQHKKLAQTPVNKKGEDILPSLVATQVKQLSRILGLVDGEDCDPPEVYVPGVGCVLPNLKQGDSAQLDLTKLLARYGALASSDNGDAKRADLLLNLVQGHLQQLELTHQFAQRNRS